MKTLCLALSLGFPVYGQSLAHIEGLVFVDEARVDSSALPVDLKPNAIVRTEAGRAEIELSAGGTLFLGENTSVRERSQLSLVAGSVVFVTGGSGGQISCENSTTLSGSGIYRFDYHPVVPARENACRFRVYRGSATVQLLTRSATLTPGETMNLDRLCGDMIPAQKFDIAEPDGLVEWSHRRLALRRP